MVDDWALLNDPAFRDEVYKIAFECLKISQFWPAPLREVVATKVGVPVAWRQLEKYSATQSMVGADADEDGNPKGLVVMTGSGSEHGDIADWLVLHELAHLVFGDHRKGQLRYGPQTAKPQIRADLFALACLVVRGRINHRRIWFVIKKFRDLGEPMLGNWNDTTFYDEATRIREMWFESGKPQK